MLDWLVKEQTNEQQSRVALDRAHTSTEATPVTELLLNIRRRVKQAEYSCDLTHSVNNRTTNVKKL